MTPKLLLVVLQSVPFEQTTLYFVYFDSLLQLFFLVSEHTQVKSYLTPTIENFLSPDIDFVFMSKTLSVI